MTSSVPGSAAIPANPAGRLSRFATGTALGLVIEAALGIGLNLYVSVPSSPSYAQVFVSIPLLTVHILLGFLLVVATGVFLVLARRSGIPGLTWKAALAFLFVVVALQEGFSFTFTQNTAFSSGMAVAFVLALVLELLVVVDLRRHSRSTGASSSGNVPTG